MIPHIKFKLQRKNLLLYFITSKYGIFILVCNKGETFARSYTSHISDKVLPKNQPTFKRIKKKERKKELVRDFVNFYSLQTELNSEMKIYSATHDSIGEKYDDETYATIKERRENLLVD